jgi:hypothetical protein
VILILLASPRTAHADLMSFWDWFDRLSGPGPWVGFVSEWNPIVAGATKEAVASAGSGPVKKTVEFDPFGTKFSQRDFHVRFGPQIGHLWALDNNQDYGGAPESSVRAFVYGATVDAGAKGVEAGIAVGRIRFYGSGFKAFSQGTIAPRVTVYPLVVFKSPKDYQDKRLDSFYIRVGANRIMGDITAEDFGAFAKTPPQPMGNEWVWGVVVSFNPLAYLRK